MFLEKISIRHLRNHEKSEIDFCKGINLFVGDNGQGKTTVLEAISIFCHTKSFHASQDKQIVSNTSEIGYSVHGRGLLQNKASYELTIDNPLIGQKKITDVTGKRVFPKDIIGEFPLVTLSPDDKELSAGGPESRRQYLDRILSQVSRPYLKDILEYRKVLKQRNKLLSIIKSETDYQNSKEESNEVSLIFWTEKLIELGVKITLRRNELITEMLPIFTKYYAEFAAPSEQVSLSYYPHFAEKLDFDNDDINQITDKFWKNYKRLKSIESIRGTSLIGPQRDELLITLNDDVAKNNASQGQHKSLLIALKFAELDYIANQTNTKPLIILDDIFSELDSKRSHKVLSILQNLGGQIFISSTDTSSFDSQTLEKSCIFDVINGKVRKRI